MRGLVVPDYLLFIERFTFGSGRRTHQYVVVGAGAGLCSVAATVASRLDPESRELPAQVDLAEAREQVVSYSQAR
jgi:predicted NUDIX family phosphoesterase